MNEGLLTVALILGLGSISWFAAANSANAESKSLGVAHNVYFKLKDNSDAKVQELIDACDKYLKPQPGVAYYAAGPVAKDLDREVNDRDWDVGLHVVFKDRESHDRYQEDAKHKQFIEENKDNWAKVRVFDTNVK